MACLPNSGYGFLLQLLFPPFRKSKIIAVGTIGTLTGPIANPLPFRRKWSATPLVASKPKAEPPERTTASIPWTVLSGSSKSVSLVPGAPPITEYEAVIGFKLVKTLTPDFRTQSSEFPTSIPGTSVIRFFGPGSHVIYSALRPLLSIRQ